MMSTYILVYFLVWDHRPLADTRQPAVITYDYRSVQECEGVLGWYREKYKGYGYCFGEVDRPR
jgi:hypothetical protein